MNILLMKLPYSRPDKDSFFRTPNNRKMLFIKRFSPFDSKRDTHYAFMKNNRKTKLVTIYNNPRFTPFYYMLVATELRVSFVQSCFRDLTKPHDIRSVTIDDECRPDKD